MSIQDARTGPMKQRAQRLFLSARCGFAVARGVRRCAVAVAGLWIAMGVLVARPAGAQDSGPPDSAAAVDAFNAAANLHNSAQYDLAAEEWKAFLKRFPKDALADRARYYLGFCHMKLKDYAAAESALETATQNEKFDLLEEALLHLGFCRFALGQQGKKDKYREAAATFGKLLKKFPKGKLADQALYYQAESWLGAGDSAKAVACYESLVKYFPQSPFRCDALYGLGAAREQRKEWTQARKAYEQFLRECGDHADAPNVRLGLASVLIQLESFSEAEPILASLAADESFEQADEARFQRAYCLYRMGRKEEAAREATGLAERKPPSRHASAAAVLAGRAWYEAKAYDRAAAVLRPLVARQATDEQARYKYEAAHWLVQALLKANKPKDAVAVFAQVQPGSAPAPWGEKLELDHAEALLQADKKDEAREAFRALAEKAKDADIRASARYNASYVAFVQKRYAEAAQDAEAFLKTDPRHTLAIDTKVLLAESRTALGKPEEAVAIYRALVAEPGDHPEKKTFPLRLAAALLATKDWQGVEKTLADRLDQWQGEHLAEARLLLGRAAFEQKAFGRAIGFLRQSILAAPNWERLDEVLLFLARAEAEFGRTQDAIGHLRKLIAECPKSALIGESYYRLGEYLARTKAYDKAIEAYDAVLQRDDDLFRPYALSGKGWALLRAGRFADADKTFSAFLDAFGEHALASSAYLGRGICRRRQSQWDAAIADFDAALKASSDQASVPRILFEKGMAQVGAGKHRQAADTFQKILSEFPAFAENDRVMLERAWALKELDPNEATKVFEQIGTKYAGRPVAAEAWFQVGESRYAAKNYAGAVEAYDKALSSTPDAELAEAILYKKGFSHYHLKQYAKAVEAFAAHRERFPKGRLAHDATFMLAECLFKERKYERAWPVFVEARKGPARTKEIAAITLLHGGQTAAAIGKWNEAKEWLSTYLREHPGGPNKAEAHLELGRALKALKDTDAAVAEWRKAVAEGSSVAAVRAQFLIGEAAFERKAFDEALKAFRLAMYRYGAEKAPSAFHPWQARATFEAARCHEVRIRSAETPAARRSHLLEARRYYQQLLEKYPQSELADAARKRLEALAQLQ